MRFKTPHFGPHAGITCRVLDDGTLEPISDSGGPSPCIHPVALPDTFGSPDDPGKARMGIDRAAKLLHQEYERRGGSQTYDDARARVVQARTRQDNH